MLRYLSHLEVWQLGSTAPIENGEEVHEGILPLTEDPVLLLTLKSRGGDVIVCAGMSNNGKWIAYSSVSTLCFFRFQPVSLQINVYSLYYFQTCKLIGLSSYKQELSDVLVAVSLLLILTTN